MYVCMYGSRYHNMYILNVIMIIQDVTSITLHVHVM